MTRAASGRRTGHDAGDASGRRATPSERRAAKALALAICAGAWTPRSARERCRRALGARPPWLAALVRAAFREFPERPTDPDALARRLRVPESCRVVRWYVVEPAMRPRWGVPAWVTAADLAAALGVSLAHLAWLADPRGMLTAAASPRLRHYRATRIPKRHGGTRLIEAPKARLKRVQQRILHAVLDRIPLHPAATGFRRGTSVAQHAAAHCGAAVVLRMDLRDFFESTTAARVTAVFRAAGYRAEVARLLGGLTTTSTPAAERLRRANFGRHLPQGAPTSPALANLCARGLDRRLSGLAARRGLRYSRYADDLVFSGALSPASAARLTTLVAAICTEEGHAVNHRKTRIMGRGQRQAVTGIVVNEHPNIAREDFDRLKAILHNCARLGPATQNRGDRPDFRAWLLGRVSWVALVNPARGAKLRALFDRIDWPTAPRSP